VSVLAKRAIDAELALQKEARRTERKKINRTKENSQSGNN